MARIFVSHLEKENKQAGRKRKTSKPLKPPSSSIILPKKTTKSLPLPHSLSIYSFMYVSMLLQ
jgi:hypothetical protein